jgi:3-phenylpropionate/cinnamic acid dioxygenase small subunit
MPLARNVRRDDLAKEYSGEFEAAWFDEGIETLRQRVAQMKTGIHWAEEPPSRVSHLVTNIRIVDAQPSMAEATEVTVSSRFLVYQNRHQTETALFVGRRKDVLTRHEGQWKILRRTVYLAQNVLMSKSLTTFF